MIIKEPLNEIILKKVFSSLECLLCNMQDLNKGSSPSAMQRYVKKMDFDFTHCRYYL